MIVPLNPIMNGLITYRRGPWLTPPPEGYRHSSNRPSFTKLLLSVGLILWAVHAAAQEVGHHGERLSDALPPTTVVASSPAASPSPVNPSSRPAVTVQSAANPKPVIIWHQVHGRWHWHCLTHCLKYRRHHDSPGEEVTEFDDSSGHYQGPLHSPQERSTQNYVDPGPIPGKK
jgi:hypothetical protein